MIVYGVVSAKTERAFELFVRREGAEAIVEDVRADEPRLADVLRVEPIELIRAP